MIRDLFDPPPEEAFDGETYSASLDYIRLKGQLGSVFRLMKDGRWRTLRAIANEVKGSEAAISARLRDFRKAKYGAFIVERKPLGGGLYMYRLLASETE